MIFGMLLDVEQGHAGALGTVKKSFDTWILTPKIISNIRKGKIKAGHQMIIIGYDDNMVIETEHGDKNRGVFILRNSWGKSAGDRGNFYVSYQYFKALSDEAQAIVPVN